MGSCELSNLNIWKGNKTGLGHIYFVDYNNCVCYHTVMLLCSLYMYSIVFFNYKSDVFVTLCSLNAADNTIFAFEETIYGLCGRQPTDYCRQVSTISYTCVHCSYIHIMICDPILENHTSRHMQNLWEFSIENFSDFLKLIFFCIF